ncbi:glycoside hydrolase family 13 protein [Roseateles amylovorans]|uniref:Glycoside hydrolase family 13 protein n=1 Tax=Roseateles amylovorans TaxID=2978473 RepID=A0ABY6ATK4_9BURK|nr:glycoside hydrolase family 13 protein [Roseateles amylovorans]UXH76347.1 glycoside hydrolase family 13 protein [Roseateles amylovorans]
MNHAQAASPANASADLGASTGTHDVAYSPSPSPSPSPADGGTPTGAAATSMPSEAPSPVASAFRLDHVEPPSWWIGMKRPALQVLLHGPGIGALTVALVPKDGVTLLGVQRGDSPNYLFVDLHLDASATPGALQLQLKRGDTVVLTHAYPLQAREPGSAQRQGFGPKDAIYLVVPDRFANGDPSLDRVDGLTEGPNRADPGGRHGGDLAGLTRHLDYIADMGFTMIWPTPLSENNSARWSYHGYAATDFYRVDARFGSNDDYRRLSVEARAKGLGLIQDVVLNHIGSHHWWMKDLPTADWINTWPQYTETHHARMSLQDPYAAPSDRKRFSDGWFSPGMPDLNQRQPLLETYLTQMSLWWIEQIGLAGVRTDTYSYSDRAFLTAWSSRLREEYPRLNIVGEEWSPHPAVVAYWQAGKRNHDGYVSALPSLMDFPLHEALLAGMTQHDSHDGGFMKLYEALAHDFVYPDPGNLVLFEGNHDTPRLYSMLHEDLALTTMAWTYLAFVKRIPQFFYGTEVLLTSPRERDDGAVRADFPGGWSGDRVNAFTGEGLRDDQRRAQAFLKRLLNWRKHEPLAHDAALMQYAPLDGCFVLFRYAGSNEAQGAQGGQVAQAALAAQAPPTGRRLMLVMNKRPEPHALALDRFPEMIRGGESATDVLTGQRHILGATLQVPGRSALLLSIE